MGIINIIVLSFLPAIIYSFVIYITVPYKTINLKTGLFYLIGGFLSIGLLMYFFQIFPTWSNLSSYVSDPLIYPLHYLHFQNFIQIGLIEELSKLGTFFLLERYRNNQESRNDHPLAIMFYVGMVSLGFAVIENIQYALNSTDPGDTIMWRSVTAVIGHMVFGMFMGYWISIGRLKPRLKNRSLFDLVILKADKFKRKLFIFIGLGAATILHGIYDLHLAINGNAGISTLYMLLIMSLLGVFWCFKNIHKLYQDKLES
jgi:RsiW-degrading membrane proteinase PrsW (M82 family)